MTSNCSTIYTLQFGCPRPFPLFLLLRGQSSSEPHSRSLAAAVVGVKWAKAADEYPIVVGDPLVALAFDTEGKEIKAVDVVDAVVVLAGLIALIDESVDP